MLLHLHRHRDRVVSRREFLAEVWGYDEPDLETRTVDIHLQRLRRKLETVSYTSTWRRVCTTAASPCPTSSSAT